MKKNIFKMRLEQLILKAPKATEVNNHIIRYFPQVHLGNSHDGLAELAKKHSVDVRNLKIGEFVIFVNTKQTACKLFAPGNTIAYFKTPNGERIDPRTISLIPRFFNGSQINYHGALKEVIKKHYRSYEKSVNSYAQGVSL